MNGWLSMSPTVPPISVMMTSGWGTSLGLKAHPALDLVGDVRNNLHGVAEVLATAFPRDDLGVDLPRGDVRGLSEVDVEESLVVTDVEIGLRAIVGDEHLTVLEGVHRAGIHVEVRVQFLHHNAQPACGEKVSETCCRESLTETRNDTTRHENVFCNHRI